MFCYASTSFAGRLLLGNNDVSIGGAFTESGIGIDFVLSGSFGGVPTHLFAAAA
jgi:hypothetical protein